MKLLQILSASAIAVLLGAAIGCAPAETRQEPDEFLSDTWIQTKVKAAVIADEDLRGMDVNVEVHEGVVQLSGFVDEAEQITEAERVAAEIEGVQSVVNDLQLKPRATG